MLEMMDFEGKELVRRSVSKNLQLQKQLVQMQQQLTQLAQVTVSAVPEKEPDISDGEEGEIL